MKFARSSMTNTKGVKTGGKLDYVCTAPPLLFPSSTPTTRISGLLILATVKQVSFLGSYWYIFVPPTCQFQPREFLLSLCYAVIGTILLTHGACSARIFFFFFLVLVSPGQDAKDWKIEVLTVTHNGDNDAEVERVHKNHPGEPECVVDRRVLGALAPTRCELI